MASVLTWGLASVLATSFTICALLVLTQRWHGWLSLDHDTHGAQKIHKLPVPRIGGLALILSLMVGALVGYAMDGKSYPVVLNLLICAAPAFIAGFWEDLTKTVSVRTRLYASFVSAALAAWLMDASLVRLDTPGLDNLIVFGPISILFTCFAVGGMTNAVNIIDGLNGLAAGCVALMLAGLGAIAWQAGDLMVMKLCLWGIAALIGFLILNFPFGRIFLGDGGAYLGGFWLAECAVLLLRRNPDVSTWAVLLCCMYPAWETIFTMYRRNVVQRVSSGQPDMVHFHHLVYSASSQQGKNFKPFWFKHGLASVSIWMLVAGCQVIAVTAYKHTGTVIMGAIGFAVLYQWLYGSMQRTFNGRNESPIHSVAHVKGS